MDTHKPEATDINRKRSQDRLRKQCRDDLVDVVEWVEAAELLLNMQAGGTSYFGRLG